MPIFEAFSLIYLRMRFTFKIAGNWLIPSIRTSDTGIFSSRSFFARTLPGWQMAIGSKLFLSKELTMSEVLKKHR